MKVDLGGNIEENDELSNASGAAVLISASGDTTLPLNKLNVDIKADCVCSCGSDCLGSTSKGCLCTSSVCIC